MHWLDRARKVVSDLFHRDRFERELDDELQTFLDLSAEDRERGGASPSEARRAARVSLGGVEACKEEVRAVRIGTTLESIARDVRFSARLLGRSPGFATAAILTIAFGIFPLAAIAGLVNEVFFQPPPGVTGADALVHVEFIARDETGDTDRAELSYLNHADVMRGVKSLDGLAGRAEGSVAVVVPGVDAFRVDVDFVTHDFFHVLGMRMAAGRAFLPEDDREPGGAPVAIVGHALATRLFATPEQAPGRSVVVNGRGLTVVGVAPPEFRGLKNDHYSQLWIPGAASIYVRHSPSARWVQTRSGGLMGEFVGRLAAHADVEHVRAELTAAVRALARAYPVENARFRTAEIAIERQPGKSFSGGSSRSRVTFMVTLLMAAGSLLLLLAGANVGNLLLFRGARRREEMAMRSALGASRWRLLRAHLIEASMIALAGGVIGLGLTFGLERLLGSAIIPNVGFVRLPIDWRLGGLVLAGSVVVGLIFGAASAAVATSDGVARAVRRMSSHSGRRLRNSLTVVQLAISLSLLVGAILLLVSIRNLLDVNLGFDPARVATAEIFPHDNGYDDGRARAFYRTLLERAATMPALGVVSISEGAPIVGGLSERRVHLPGVDPTHAITVAANGVTAGYFLALGLPVRGRAFSEDEAFAQPDGTCGPVVVSDALATRLFNTRDALNQIVVIAGAGRRPSMDCLVVGVAADVRINGSAADWEPILYRPLSKVSLLRVTVLARSDGPLPLASAALREAAASIDPALPLYGRASLAEGIAFQTAGPRIISVVLGLLALVGLSMATVGLYGLVAETVVDRTREFAVRMAIGATPRSILLAVLHRAMVLAGIGIAVGLMVAAGVSQTIRSQLFGVTEMALWAYLSAAGLLATVVTLASLAPAIKATRMNPVDVLRAD